MTFGVASRRTALLAGATGLVGGHCLELLLQDGAWGQVAVLGRREIGTTHRKLVQPLTRSRAPLNADDPSPEAVPKGSRAT